MKCHFCGANLNKKETNLPFRTDYNSIVIIKNMPVLECENCHEFLIDDSTIEIVDEIIENVDRGVELEILRYASRRHSAA